MPRRAPWAAKCSERLFTKAFVDKIDNGTYRFANTGTYSFTSDDGKFTNTVTGDGGTTINGLADAARCCTTCTPSWPA